MAEAHTEDNPTSAAATEGTPKAAPKRRAPATGARKPRTTTRAKAVAAAPAVRQRINHVATSLDDQLEETAGSIAILRQRVDALIEEAADDARHLASGAGRTGRAMARRAGHQVASAAESVRDNPIPTVIGLGLIALVTGLLVSRHESRW